MAPQESFKIDFGYKYRIINIDDFHKIVEIQYSYLNKTETYGPIPYMLIDDFLISFKDNYIKAFKYTFESLIKKRG